MARSRNIKPAFFSNEVLGETSPLARLLFIALWTLADREGRLENRPKKIKIEALPYDDCDISALLLELSRAGFIHLYEVEKVGYIQVVNFKKHQNPHMKEQASTIPAPDMHHACTEQAVLIPSSLIPHTDSLSSSPEVSSAAKASPKSTRLPSDWSLPDEWEQWAVEYMETINLSPDLGDIPRQADQFRDYWLAASGSKARKTDWQATWRNWIRRWADGELQRITRQRQIDEERASRWGK